MKLSPPQMRRRGGVRRAAGRPPARKVMQGKPPGTRRTEGSLETQADLAADQAVRRMTNVSRGLTQAPPAKYDAPSSVGVPLAEPVREDLETTFGADLAAVRVHHDAAAHTAAHREEADAFTAGRHVYFAQGKYDPGSTDGRRLLAHEVAHVLQQTGRRFSTTLIQATEREGTGDIQRASRKDAQAPAFSAFARRYGLELACLRAAVTDPMADPDDDDDDQEERHG